MGATSLLDCESCPQGRYGATSGLEECTPCDPGKTGFGRQSGETLEVKACASCRGGTFNPFYNCTSECSSCQNGKSAAAGAPFCYYLCELGFFFANSKCTACPTGKYTDKIGIESEDDCSMCETGQACTGGRQREPCPAGKWSAETGASSLDETCQPCKIGTFSGFAGIGSKDLCQTCAPGSYGEESGQTNASSACTLCSKGEYQGQAGQSKEERPFHA